MSGGGLEPAEAGASILIVDDLPDHLAFAGAILRQQGYRVHAAASGKAALAFLARHMPDLIVLDVHMEGMDGMELCRRIKQQERTKDIPVIFVTADSHPAAITAGFEAGCCDYVSKPFVRAEYLARISAHLRIAQQTRALADAYDELDRFCSAVSHDLKSPLGVMRMLLSALREEMGSSLEGEAARIVTMLDDKAGELTAMVNRLLEFSRMCNIKPSFEMLDLAAILRACFHEQQLAEPDRRVVLRCGTLPPVRGDAVLIRMMLKNIISNAFKFTRTREEAVIEVRASEEDGFTVISVRDNGVGFDMAYAGRLFRIFQRLHEQSEFEGTGVGLAMADRIMRRHGGRIRMEGKVNEGAEVFLYFPRCEQ